MTKYVYLFKEGNASMRNLLGGKGANLAEMTNLGLPVPQGFTVSTEACTRYYEDGSRSLGEDHASRSTQLWPRSKKICGKKFGDPENPLLVSVRSGARASMPGMMDTILNLGLNDEVAARLSPTRPEQSSALRTTATAASSRCSPTSSWSSPKKHFEQHHRRDEGRARASS